MSFANQLERLQSYTEASIWISQSKLVYDKSIKLIHYEKHIFIQMSFPKYFDFIMKFHNSQCLPNISHTEPNIDDFEMQGVCWLWLASLIKVPYSQLRAYELWVVVYKHKHNQPDMFD